MRAALFLSLMASCALASCAGTRVGPPLSDKSDNSDLSDLAAPTPTLSPAAAPTTGQVEFRGFTDEALADFRIIPEEGTGLFTPTNGRHPNVDGFWWRPSRQWFKIPNHCAVIVTAAPEPDRPSAFTETHDCSDLGTAIQKLRGLPDTAGFYPDLGATGHGTDYPFPL